MPENPEIRVISEYLDKVWKDKIIVGLLWDSKSKFRKNGIKGLELIKLPCNVVSVIPRGKLIIIEVITKDENTIYMVSQLGMEGKWIHKKEKHSNFHIQFGRYDEDKKCYIITDRYYFNDQRHFGNFGIYDDLETIFKRHGPCLLTTALILDGKIKKTDLKPYQKITSLKHFTDKIRNPRIQNKMICDFLMEQKHVSGIGNYIRIEVLFRCKMNPKKQLSDFSEDDISILYRTILEQLLISYNARGLTIKSYWDPEGRKGLCPLQVYNKTVDPSGNKVEKFKDRSKRTVHWVPVIQLR